MGNKNVPEIRFLGFEGEWEEKIVGDYFDFKNGLNKSKEFFGSGFPIVNFTDVFNKRGLIPEMLKGKVDVTGTELSNYGVRLGDVFFTRTSETIDEIGYPSVMLKEVKNTVFSGFVLRCRAISFDPLALLFKQYVFFTEDFRKEMTKKSSMTTRALTSGTAIKRMVFNFPFDKTEQTKIGSYFKNIDYLITMKQRKLDKLKIVKKSMLEKMFPREGAAVPEIRFQGFSGDWERKALGELTTINQGLQIAISHRYTKRIIGSYFYITNEFLKADSETQYYILSPPDSVLCNENDVLMTRTGNTGQVVTGIAGAFHNNFFKIDFNRKELDKDFFVFFLSHEKTQTKILQLAGTSTIPDLNHNDFYKIKVTFPTISEQTKIGNYFKKLDHLISLQQKELEKLKQFKSSCLGKMFV